VVWLFVAWRESSVFTLLQETAIDTDTVATLAVICDEVFEQDGAVDPENAIGIGLRGRYFNETMDTLLAVGARLLSTYTPAQENDSIGVMAEGLAGVFGTVLWESPEQLHLVRALLLSIADDGDTRMLDDEALYALCENDPTARLVTLAWVVLAMSAVSGVCQAYPRPGDAMRLAAGLSTS
jgi:hypothetical protein